MRKGIVTLGSCFPNARRIHAHHIASISNKSRLLETLVVIIMKDGHNPTETANQKSPVPYYCENKRRSLIQSVVENGTASFACCSHG